MQYCGHYYNGITIVAKKLDRFDPNNFSIFELNDLAFLDYDRSYDRNAVTVLATVQLNS